MTDHFLRVNAVSYEGSVFGWDINPTSTNNEETEEDDSGLDCKLRFGFHAAQGSHRCVTIWKIYGMWWYG